MNIFDWIWVVSMFILFFPLISKWILGEDHKITRLIDEPINCSLWSMAGFCSAILFPYIIFRIF